MTATRFRAVLASVVRELREEPDAAAAAERASNPSGLHKIAAAAAEPAPVPGQGPTSEAPAGELWTREEAARYLRISPKHLSELVAAGQVPGRRIGAHYRFSRRAIDRWLETGKVVGS